MATTLQIIQGATTLADLNASASGTALDSDYTPTAGGENDPTVDETVTVIVSGANNAAVMTNRNTVLLALRAARAAQLDPSLERVYLKFQIDGGAAAWRSELIDYRIANESAPFVWGWPNLSTALILTFTRGNYWEENSDTQLALTNGNGTGVTTALNVYNCNDGTGSSPNKNNNYVDITGTDIGGDLPCPTRLEMTYNDGAANHELYQLYIGQSWHDPANFVHLYEAEAGGGTSSASASASGGNYTTKTIFGHDPDALQLSWTVSAASLNAAAGMLVKPLLRAYSTFPTALEWRFTIASGSNTIWEGPLIEVDTSAGYLIRDLGAFRLPPVPYTLGSLGALTLSLRATYGADAGVSMNYTLDDLTLLPLDGYRFLEMVNWLTNGSRVIDNGIGRKVAYSDNGAGASIVGGIRATGSPIMLYPGKNQRLYFVMHTITGNSAPIDLSLGVKLFYRPRRLAL